MGTTRSLTISRGLNVSQLILLASSKSLFAVYRLRGINSLLTRTLVHPMYGNSRQSWILEGFQEVVFEFFARWLWFWTPIVSGIPDSLSCIPDSIAQDSGFQRQRFPGLRNPDFLKWSDPLVVTWSNLVPREGKKPWERGCTVQSMRSSVYTNSEFVSILCGDKRILLLTFPRMSDATSRPGRFSLALEVGPHTRTILLQTAFNHYNGRVTTSWKNRSIYSHYYYCSYHCKQPTFSYGDVVHHWPSPLQWAIWVTKPIYILTFSYRPKSSSIMYCKTIYPSGLWLLTNDDCCAKNKVVSRVLAPARSW